MTRSSVFLKIGRENSQIVWLYKHLSSYSNHLVQIVLWKNAMLMENAGQNMLAYAILFV